MVIRIVYQKYLVKTVIIGRAPPIWKELMSKDWRSPKQKWEGQGSGPCRLWGGHHIFPNRLVSQRTTLHKRLVQNQAQDLSSSPQLLDRTDDVHDATFFVDIEKCFVVYYILQTLYTQQAPILGKLQNNINITNAISVQYKKTPFLYLHVSPSARRGGAEVAGWTLDRKIRVRFPAYPHRVWALWWQGGKRRLRTSRCPCRGRLGTLKTPSCLWRGCPAAGQKDYFGLI